MIGFQFLEAVTPYADGGSILTEFSSLFTSAFNIVTGNPALSIFVLFPVGIAALAAVVGIFVHR